MYGILIIVIEILIPLILTVRRSKHIDKTTFRYPKTVSIAGILGAATSAIPLWLGFLKGDHIGLHWISIVFLISVCALIHLGSCYLILLGANWKIELSDEGLKYTNWFGKKKCIPYSCIIEIKAFNDLKNTKIEKYKIYYQDKVITVDYLIEGFDSFLKTLKRRIKNRKNIADIMK